MRMILATAAAAIALGACGGSEKVVESGTPTAAASAPAAPVASGPAAAEMDMVAAGKWSMTTTMMGQSMPAMEVCYDKSMTFQDAQEKQKEAGVTCSEQTYRREGDKLIGHSVCTRKLGSAPMTMTTDMVITGDLKTAYQMEMTTKIDPAPPTLPAEDMRMTVAAKRLGDCDAPK